MKKTWVSLILAVLTFVCVFSVPAAAFEPTGFEITAEAAMLVSLDTGGVLYQKNIDEKMYPASLTKIMTATLIIENTPDLDSEIITVSKDAIDSLQGTDSSTTGLKEGEELTARQLLYNLLMASANDGAMAAAEHYGGGNVMKFIKMMNDRAAELGMTATHYANPHGLHDLNHYTTVSDMYKLVKHALTLPAFTEIVSTVRYQMPATNKSPAKTLSTTNWLQDPNTASYYKYAKGIKTGYTDPAGRCLISTASKDGYNYLCILMKCPVTDSKNVKVRKEFGESKNLYEWAFKSFQYKSVLAPTAPVGEIKVGLAWNRDHVTLLPEKEFSAIIPAEADASTIRIQMNLNRQEVDAPVEKGAVMGTATVIYAGEELGTVPLVAAESIEQSKILYGMRLVKTAVGSIWFKIAAAMIAGLILIFIVACILLNRRRRKRRRVRNFRRL